MPRLLLTYFACLLCFGLLNCSGGRKGISNKKSGAISSLVLFPVYSNIDVIERGDKRVRSDSLSTISQKGIHSNLLKYVPGRIHVTQLEFNDSVSDLIADEEIGIIKRVRSPFAANSAKTSGYIKHVLDSMQQDYGLFIFHAGFARTYLNQSNQYFKRKSLAVATLGFFNTEPNQSYSVLIGFIVGRKDGKVSMYKELFWRNRNPTDKYVIQTQMRDILLGYFQ